MIAYLIAAFLVVAIVALWVVSGAAGWVILGVAAVALGLGLGVVAKK